MKSNKIIYFTLSYLLTFVLSAHAQFVNSGSGSYRTTFPGTDAAGRNAYPSGTPYLSGNAVGKPVPTSDWWSALVKNGTASNLFNYPFTLKTTENGIVVSYIPNGVIDDLIPFLVGVSGLNAPKTYVSDYSDWTVTMDWNDGSHQFQTTAGVGMPFLYFTKKSTDVAQITINSGTVVIDNEMLICTNVKNGADFAVYAPTGSTWIKSGSVYTSTLNGKNYWSVAFIPLTASNVTNVAYEYKKYAYVFPVKTTANYTFNESTSVMRTDFSIQTEVKEGTETNMLIGLLPHQWAHLAAGSATPDKYSYATVRGEMKTMAGNSFSVENTFHGVLPTLPYVDNYSPGFSPSVLTGKIAELENSTMATWTDSYNEGQVFNQLMQTARIANETGNISARDKLLTTIKTRLENWFKAENGEVAFLFYYNSTWSSAIGYPAGYGQDNGLNDKQFHWGYFIAAAAFVEQFSPGWAAQWGEMVNLIVRDAAAYNRNDTMFPYLRNFSPYAGHSWVDGFANNPQGNNMESSSESMNFNAALIQWGQVTNNKSIRDLGIYLYTTEQTGIEEYYMDIHHRNFPASQRYSLYSRVWTNSNDNGTFWTADIAASYGIEMYPIQGGSLYLGQDTVYVKRLWDEIATNTGIMSNQANPNLWHDEMWKYLAFINPSKAIDMYNSYPNREIKFGISDAQTYHWLHAMNALGRIDASVTADYPIAAAFRQGNKMNYVAQNYSSSPITVTFSTGYQLTVPAGKMATSMDGSLTGTVTSSFSQAYKGGSVNLTIALTAGTPSKIEWMDGSTSLGTVTNSPYSFNAANLQPGIHNFYAKVYEGEKYTVTNSVKVIVGNQLPYGGTAAQIPGTTEAGKYDVFEGGKGQDITYLDMTTANAGNFRTDESVDASTDNTEGTIITNIAAGEWLEYTVNVNQTGLYSFAFRYASGNPSGGGPFHLEIDNQVVSPDIIVPSTSATVWNIWATKTVNDIPLVEGQHILRLVFSAGEFNLGKMTFTRTGDLLQSYVTASAGNDIKVVLPATSTILNGSASRESASGTLIYRWKQMFGPNVVQISDSTISNTVVSGLIEGMYNFRLTVKNTEGYTSTDDVLVMVTSTLNVAPTVSLTSPADNTTYVEGKPVTLSATAEDFDGTITKVEFFEGNNLISTVSAAPYTASWTPVAGNYTVNAKATDNGGAVSTSTSSHITISPLMSCTTTSVTATQGSFTAGYKCTYETVGTDVTVTFELLDDKAGVVAYLWKESPFSELAMTNVSGKVFSVTLGGQTPGTTISYACKFAFSGGMSVTKYITYVVGTNCGGTTNDTQAPTGFTASPGNVTANSVELLLNAIDNSGTVVFNIAYGSNKQTVSTASGVQKSMIITALEPATNYSFSITASDIAGNQASNNPIIIAVTTSANTNTDCSGTASEASQGSFSTGYKYNFTTSGTDVIISFEMLDDKSGLVAYLWNYTSGFAESAMTNAGGKKFSKTLSGLSAGSVIKFACKFAYAGGMVVTKQFSYTVGSNCSGTGTNDIMLAKQFFYPNPVQDMLHLTLADENNHIIITDMMNRILFDKVVSGSCDLNVSGFTPQMYVISIENRAGTIRAKMLKK